MRWVLTTVCSIPNKPEDRSFAAKEEPPDGSAITGRCYPIGITDAEVALPGYLLF